MPAARHENKKQNQAGRRPGFAFVFWVLAGACQRNGVGGFVTKFLRSLANSSSSYFTSPNSHPKKQTYSNLRSVGTRVEEKAQNPLFPHAAARLARRRRRRRHTTPEPPPCPSHHRPAKSSRRLHRNPRLDEGRPAACDSQRSRRNTRGRPPCAARTASRRRRWSASARRRWRRPSARGSAR